MNDYNRSFKLRTEHIDDEIMPIRIHQQLEHSAPFAGGWFSIGNFDGVHRGHQRMVECLVERARKANLPAVVFTFDPPPVAILAPEHVPPQLSSVERKAELLESMGVTDLLVYPTNRELLELSATEFFKQIIQEQLNARGLVEGPNFFFGKNRGGDVNMLKRLSQSNDIECEVVDPVVTNGNLISSTCIRNMIKSGKMQEAVTMLGHSYQLQGIVTEGSKRGRELGFPTANLEQIATLIPAEGVYAGLVLMNDRRLPAAVHIGPNPTFDEFNKKVEVHLLDFTGELYGQQLTVEFVSKLRDTHPFESRDALVAQLQKDIYQTRTETKAILAKTT